MMGSINQYRLQIRLLSEAIFSSGEKEPNLVQSKVLADRHGFVYLHAKTLKGQMKRQAFWLLKQYASLDAERAKSFLYSIASLFGINKWELQKLKWDYSQIENIHATAFYRYISELLEENDKAGQVQHRLPTQGIMKLGHLELPKVVRAHYKELLIEQTDEKSNGSDYIYLSRHDLIEAQTFIRIGIQLMDGSVKDKMLTSCHTVKEGLIFYASLILDQTPVDEIWEDLKRIVYVMDRIGAGIHRGRGEIEAKLFVETGDAEGAEGGTGWREILSGH